VLAAARVLLLLLVSFPAAERTRAARCVVVVAPGAAAAVSVLVSAAAGPGGKASPLAEDAEPLGGFEPCDVCACVCVRVCRDSVRDPLDNGVAVEEGCPGSCCWSAEDGVRENEGGVCGDWL